ncbi:MAG: isopenicillin N synthase family oxygenase [Myxococcales bacterium]|nr:isopenicillin N synthase family oxygenase [Myxococcales bacterium]
MTTIPVLDFRRYRSDFDGFARDLGSAWHEIGFVAIRDHGVSPTLIDGAYQQVKAFFDLPLETRLQYELKGMGGARGYTRFGVEHAKDSGDVDLKEFWHVGRELPEGSPYADLYPANVWPKELPAFKPRLLGLFHTLERVGNALLRAIARYLGVADGYFEDKVDHGDSILRPIHYPPIADPDGARGVRSGQHEDINLITLLVASGEPGLEVLSREGAWVPVVIDKGTIVVNVGDMLQRLTNHVLRSTTHRVVNPPAPYSAQPRYSMPFFHHPNPEFVIETLPCCVTADNPNRYPEAITAGEYLRQRLIEIGLLPGGRPTAA